MSFWVENLNSSEHKISELSSGNVLRVDYCRFNFTEIGIIFEMNNFASTKLMVGESYFGLCFFEYSGKYYLATTSSLQYVEGFKASDLRVDYSDNDIDVFLVKESELLGSMTGLSNLLLFVISGYSPEHLLFKKSYDGILKSLDIYKDRKILEAGIPTSNIGLESKVLKI